MIGVSKIYEKKPVLKDIYLSYFYGAKIGVIGLNGSGKSSLLKILAGVDNEFPGQDHSFRRVIPWAIWSRNRVWTKPKPCGRLWSRACKARWI